MRMIEHIHLSPVTPCANVACSNEVGGGAFSLAGLETGENIGDGTGRLDLLLCTPCFYVLNEALLR